MPDRPLPPRVAVVHIGKTGGTSIKAALRPHYETSEVCPLQFEMQYPDSLDEVMGYRLYDSHFGFDLASQLNAKLVTVLRNPFERLVSLYYYWREVPPSDGGPGWAKRLDFDRFLEVARSIPVIGVNTHDAQTWQIAFGTTMTTRQANLHLSDDDLLRQAIANLDRFDVVGTTEDMDAVFEAMDERLGFAGSIRPKRVNVTGRRARLADIPIATRRRMAELIHVDLALYDHVRTRRE